MSFTLSTQPYKGTRDFYPEDMRIRNWLFEKIRKVCRLYGYEEYDGPMLESFDLYAAKTGEEIVNNELYSLEDRGGRKLVIRPEMTPTVARMVAARVQDIPKPIRWFSIPNCMRAEAPQRGRLREFWQLNVDLLGVESLDAEIENITLAKDILLSLGATTEMFECRINSRKLIDEIFESLNINSDQKYKVSKAIDKKSKISDDDFIKMLSEAGCNEDTVTKLQKCLSGDLEYIQNLIGKDSIALNELITLLELLNTEGDSFVVFDPTVMRGFDYYTGIVIEFFDKDPANKRSLFGGGRYDDLVAIFNGQKVPAFGFAMGDVILKDFCEIHGLIPVFQSETQAMVVNMGIESKSYAEDIVKKLRSKGVNTSLYLNEEKLDKQLKYASSKNIKFVVIAGSDEIASQSVKIKNMIERNEVSVSRDQLEEYDFRV